MTIKLNADLGEGFGPWQMQNDEVLMPHIDMANVACGGHAGDSQSMIKAIKQAKRHNVALGAHPSYPDIRGFGRRSMNLSEAELVAEIQGQIATLDGLAKSYLHEVTYVKPHGALYNDAMQNKPVRTAIFKSLKGFYRPLPLMLQAGVDDTAITNEAKGFGIDVIFEAFADRAYQDNGLLVPRRQHSAVLNTEMATEQARAIIGDGKVVAVSGRHIELRADTICVHGDTREALEQVTAIRHLLDDQ